MIGALINSDTGELSLDTGNLVVADLSDSDRYSRTGGGITIGTGGSFPVQSLNFDIQEDEIDGVTRGTIGLGEVSIRNLTPDEAVELIATFNRDPQAFQQILRERHFYATGELDVQAFLAIPQNLLKIAHAIAALATPVPDNVRAQGPEATLLFRRMIFNGISPDEVVLLSQTSRFARQVRVQQTYANATAAGVTLSTEELALIVQREILLYGEASDYAGGAIVVLSSDHVHMCGSVPPKVSIGNLMRAIKGRTSRKIQQEFPELKKRDWGRRFSGRGYFSTTSGKITEETILQYIERHSEKPIDYSRYWFSQIYQILTESILLVVKLSISLQIVLQANE